MGAIRFILASGSPRRKELLSQVGISFEVIVSDVEEHVTSTDPKAVVEELSLQKAQDVFAKVAGDVVVIGADTVVSADNKILGKPANADLAYEMLRGIAGTSHSVFTGVTLCIRRGDMEEIITFSEETKVFVDEMSDDDIMNYIATGTCYDKAGGYGIQGSFAAYVSGISGDYNNVVGLPVGRICRILRENNIRYN